jgi:hypothetical protein
VFSRTAPRRTDLGLAVGADVAHKVGRVGSSKVRPADPPGGKGHGAALDKKGVAEVAVVDQAVLGGPRGDDDGERDLVGALLPSLPEQPDHGVKVADAPGLLAGRRLARAEHSPEDVGGVIGVVAHHVVRVVGRGPLAHGLDLSRQDEGVQVPRVPLVHAVVQHRGEAPDHAEALVQVGPRVYRGDNGEPFVRSRSLEESGSKKILADAFDVTQIQHPLPVGAERVAELAAKLAPLKKNAA